MSIKISELPQASTVNNTDVIPIVQGGTTKQANLGIVASAGGVPTNSIIQYDGNTIPAGYEEVNGYDIYSTTEQRIGTWINGKPLYEKTYTGNAPYVATNGTWVSAKFPTPDNFELGFVKYAFCVDSSNQCLALPFITNSGYLLKTYFGNDNGDWLILSSNYTGTSNRPCYITVAYTKTTDSAS